MKAMMLCCPMALTPASIFPPPVILKLPAFLTGPTLFLIQFKFIGDTYKSHVEGLPGEKAVCLQLSRQK